MNTIQETNSTGKNKRKTAFLESRDKYFVKSNLHKQATLWP